MAIWASLIQPVAGLFTKALDIIDDIVPDKDLAEKLKNQLSMRINELAHSEFITLIENQSKIIIAEATGSSWLQRNWRPGLMAIFGAILANNYVVAPYVGLFLGEGYRLILEVPADMWSLLKLGLAGYIAGRSAEKIADGDGLKSIATKILNGK